MVFGYVQASTTWLGLGRDRQHRERLVEVTHEICLDRIWKWLMMHGTASGGMRTLVSWVAVMTLKSNTILCPSWRLYFLKEHCATSSTNSENVRKLRRRPHTASTCTLKLILNAQRYLLSTCVAKDHDKTKPVDVLSIRTGWQWSFTLYLTLPLTG